MKPPQFVPLNAAKHLPAPDWWPVIEAMIDCDVAQKKSGRKQERVQ